MLDTKEYNPYPAYKKLTVSKSSRCYLSKDEAACKEKGLNALDFALWYDERLLGSGVPLSLSPFRYILKSIDEGVISHNAIVGNYRLACLLLAKFVNCDTARIKGIEADYLIDHPAATAEPPKAKAKTLDYATVYDYDHTAANKIIFPYMASKGIDKALTAELISRGLLAFDGRYSFKNLVFVCNDVTDFHGFEVLGMSEAKHFMQFSGEAFPFLYYREELERIDYTDFLRAEVFNDTLEMLRHLTELKKTDEGIPQRVLFVSLHTSNYSMAAYTKYRKIFGNLHENWHCDRKGDGGQTTAAEEQPTEDNAEAAAPVDYPFKYYSRAELLEMRDNNRLSTELFAKCVPWEEQTEHYTFEEIIELPQAKDENGKIYFELPNEYRIDIFGTIEGLPF